MDSPPSVSAPAFLASLNNGVSSGLYTRSYTKASFGMRSALNGLSYSVGLYFMPTDVQFTSRSQSCSAALVSSSDQGRAASGILPADRANDLTRLLPLSTNRLNMVTDVTSSFSSANTTALATPPAPSNTTFLLR